MENETLYQICKVLNRMLQYIGRNCERTVCGLYEDTTLADIEENIRYLQTFLDIE